jgi:hypothetical protein
MGDIHLEEPAAEEPAAEEPAADGWTSPEASSGVEDWPDAPSSLDNAPAAEIPFVARAPPVEASTKSQLD